MALAPYLASYWQNRGLVESFIVNPAFQAYPTTPGDPTGWALQAGTTPTRVLTGQSPLGSYAMRLIGGAAADGYERQATPTFVFPGPNFWYTVEAVVTLVSGALTGSGIIVQGTLANNSTVTSDGALIPFATTPDVNGTVIGAGTPGTTYRWRVLVQFKDPTTVGAAIYPCSHFSTLGSTAGANSIDWSQCSLRPSWPAEIAASNQVQSLPVMPLLPGADIAVPKKPMWSTGVRQSASGRERRTPYWSAPRWAFELTYNVLRDRVSNGELDGMWEFFNTVQGRYAEFLYLDQDDYVVAGDQFGTGDGTTTVFQIQRKIRTYLEPIYAPFAFAIYKAGVLQTNITHYTVSNNGVITFVTAPANGAALTWYGNFFFRCRMQDDENEAAKMFYQLWSSGLKFISVKP